MIKLKIPVLMEGIKQDRKNSNVVIATRPGMNLHPTILAAKL